MGQIRLMPAGLMRRRVAQGECGFCASARGPVGEVIMMCNLKGSLLIASMLVVLWTTSSEACRFCRRACQPTQSYCQSGYGYGSPTGYYASGQGGYVTQAAVTMVVGIPAERPAIPLAPATASPAMTSAGPATTRAASAGRRPGWGCGPAWASAASARGADRPQVLRSPCGGARPGPTGSLGAASAQ